jgi:MFS family permease
LKLGVPDFTAIGRAFANRNYAIYAAGNAVSLVGTWVQRVAVGWFAWELTHSGFWLGAVAFADLFPVVVVGPLAGVLADRIQRWKLVLACQIAALAQAGLLFVLAALGAIGVEGLVLLTFALGFIVGVHQPARLSFVPSLVPARDLATAVAISSVIFNLARFVGPAISGLVIVGFGIAPAFLLNALSYLAAIAALLALRLGPERPAERRAAGGVVREAHAGIRYAFRHPAIARLLSLSLAVSLFARPLLELLPAFADAAFAMGAGGLAALTSAAGLGALAAGLWLAQRGAVAGLSRIALASAFVSGLAAALFAAVPSFALALPAAAAAGFGMVASGISVQTLIQSCVEDAMRGRVLSLWGLIFRGAPALGAFAMGWLSGYVGLAPPPVAGGLLCAALALLAFRWRRRLVALIERRDRAGEEPPPG